MKRNDKFWDRGMRQLLGVLPLSSLLVLALPVVEARPATQRSVEVEGERVLLSDLINGLTGELAALDIGPAPSPGNSSLFRAVDIRRRLDRAMMKRPTVRLPRRVRVYRRAQRVDEQTLERLVRQSLSEQLPKGARVRRLTLPGGQKLPIGKLDVEVEPVGALRSGRQTMRVSLRAGENSWRRLLVVVDLELPKASDQGLINRGDRVTILVLAPGVRLQAIGVAQNRAAVGEQISVMPTTGRKILHGRVRDAKTVEVEL